MRYQIERASILDAEAERNLAQAIHSPAPDSPWDFDRHLAAVNDARNAIVRANSPLVANIARRYLNRGVDFEDLCQEGHLGLLKAALKFDHTRGLRFSTYATWWIHQSIKKTIPKISRVVHLNKEVLAALKLWDQAEERLERKIGRKPENDEIAAEMETMMSDKILEKLKKKLGRSPTEAEADTEIQKKLPASRSEDIASARRWITGRAASGEWQDLVNSEDEEDELLENQLRVALHELRQLDERLRLVISQRVGLDGEGVRTFNEIGKSCNVSRQRAKELFENARNRLKITCC
jgi:RNA polymerase primary sigma factor